MNDYKLGITLKTTIKDNNVSYISLTTEDNKVINFLDVIRKKGSFLKPNHRHDIKVYTADYNLYLVRDNVSYVLAVKRIDDYNIDKIRFSLQGVVMNRLTYYLGEANDVILR